MQITPFFNSANPIYERKGVIKQVKGVIKVVTRKEKEVWIKQTTVGIWEESRVDTKICKEREEQMIEHPVFLP